MQLPRPWILTLSLATLGLAALPALSEDNPVSAPNSKISLSGVGWARYYYILEDVPKSNEQRDLNSFDVDRIYLTGNYQVDDRYKWVTMLEARNRAGTLSLFLKKGYLAIKEPFHLGDTNLYFGQMDHVMVAYQDKVWGHRIVSAVPLDGFLGVSAAQVGAGLDGSVAEGKIDWAATVSNARPYDKEIKTKYKTAAGRVALTPFSSGGGEHAHLALFAQIDNDESPTKDNLNFTWSAFPYYKTDRLTAAIEFSSRADKKHSPTGGRSVAADHDDDTITVTANYVGGFLTYLATEKVGVFGRFDHFDPDTDTDDDGGNRVILGLSHRYAKGLRSLVDVDYTKFEEAKDEDLDPQVTISARLEVTY